jgi:hypothetical protein
MESPQMKSIPPVRLALTGAETGVAVSLLLQFESMLGADAPAPWRIIVANDTCPDVTWGFQSLEGVLRTFYPARRMEREHGIPMAVAEHIEPPSLPWGMASLMAGCGIRWTSVPFLDYDSTFKGLKTPPCSGWKVRTGATCGCRWTPGPRGKRTTPKAAICSRIPGA